MLLSVVSKALVERLGLGRSTTRRLVSLTGGSFRVEQALRIGRVDHILEVEELDQYITGIVRRWNHGSLRQNSLRINCSREHLCTQ